MAKEAQQSQDARIVLFGATGYTGSLTAQALVERGASPVLAGRNQAALEQLADELDGDIEVAVADATDPTAVRALLEPGDVIVSTVGPFIKFGEAAVAAAAEMGAHYLDSTGEGPFVRSVFERHGQVAESSGATLLTAFGFDYVPGNLAGALALEEAGAGATQVDVCYVARNFSTSGGTRASIAGIMLQDGYAFRDATMRNARMGGDVRRFQGGSRPATGLSVSATEQYGLPASYDDLRDVSVYVAVPPGVARTMALAGLAITPVRRIGALRSLAGSLAERFIPGSTGGPTPEQRARASVEILAEAGDGSHVTGRSRLRGGDPYDFTAEILAWGAVRAASGGLRAKGACGPVEAFGLKALQEGCGEAGLVPA